jgi:hypothetical protein
MLDEKTATHELVGESFGSAKALRDVCKSHVQTVHNVHVMHRIAHSFCTLFGFSPTKFMRAIITIFLIFFGGFNKANFDMINK